MFMCVEDACLFLYICVFVYLCVCVCMCVCVCVCFIGSECRLEYIYHKRIVKIITKKDLHLKNINMSLLRTHERLVYGTGNNNLCMEFKGLRQ